MADRRYLDYIRAQCCAMCGRPPLSQAHHHTGGRGRGQKADDRRTIPLCTLCHHDFHAACGRFKAMLKRERRHWQDRMVDFYQKNYPAPAPDDTALPEDLDVF